MKKTVIIGFMMICASSTGMADGFDYVDADIPHPSYPELAYNRI